VEIDKKVFEKQILKGEFNNNVSKCAKALGLDPPRLSKFVKHGTGVGPLFLGRLAAYCVKSKKNFWDFIILPKV
jgi:plasmid maintenance system antidote protein VapI